MLLVLPKFTVPFLSDEDLAYATPEEAASYHTSLKRELALQSPLDLACLMYPETRRWPHIELLNEHLVALAEYRLTKYGPGVPGTTKLVYNEIDESLKSAKVMYRKDSTTLPTEEDVVFKLTVSMRPRAGKSRLINEVFPLWLLLHDPDLAIAVGTYSDTFADTWGEKLRDNTLSLKDALPFLPQPAGGKNAARDTFKVLNAKGSVAFTGVGGGITGKGFQVMIGDDFVKDDVAAQSPTIRQAAKGFYDSVWDTRGTISFTEGARFPIPLEVLMGTRWHHDDVIGHAAYDHDEDGTRRPSPNWCILNIPAQCEDPEGDPLGRQLGEAHPNASGEGEEFLERKKKQNPRVYAALYQGRPSPEGGGLVPNTFNTYQVKHDKDEVFFVFEKLTGNIVDGSDEEDRFDTCSAYVKDMIPFTSIDMAATKKTTSDYTVGFNCLYSREHHAVFLTDRFRERITTDEYERKLIPFARGNGTKKWLVEDVTFGKQFGDTLLLKYKFQVDKYPAVADKVSRAVSSTLPDMMRRMQFYVFWPPKEPKAVNLADEIDEHVDRQQRRRRRRSNNVWSNISR